MSVNNSGHARRFRPQWYLIPISLLVCAWNLTTPPWAGPDEAAHYIKALGTVSTDPVGHAAIWREPEVFLPPPAQTYMGVTSRSYPVSAPLTPRIPTVPCFALQSSVSAACGDRPSTGPVQTISYVGAYQPLYYVLPGLAAHLAGSAVGGLRAGRLVGSIEVLAMVAVALALLDPGGAGPPAVGVLLALTPMTISLAGTMTANSFEIVGAMLFMSACVRLLRSPRPSTALLVLAVIAGTLAAWSRPLGPVWVAGALLLGGSMAGRRRVADLSKERGMRLAGVALGALTAGSVWWDLETGFGSGTSRTSVSNVLHQLPSYASRLSKELIGVFGWLDVGLPQIGYVAGYVLLITALAGALVFGRVNDRIALLLGAACFVGTVLLLILATTTTGFDVQARYVLPVWALVAVVVGDSLSGAAERRRYGSWARRTATAWVILFAVLNTGAVYVNARRYAVGAGRSWVFFRHAQWSPPGGWIPSLIMVALAGIGLVGAALLEVRPPPGADQRSSM